MSLEARLQVYNAKPGAVDDNGNTTNEQVGLTAVYSSDPESENYSFSKATPSAHLQMVITNPDAMGFFQEGKQYRVTFEQA